MNLVCHAASAINLNVAGSATTDAIPDLSVQSASLNKTTYTSTEVGSVTVTVKNQGKADTGVGYAVDIFRHAPQDVDAESGATASAIYKRVNRPALAANTSDTFVIPFVNYAASGTFVFRVLVNSTNAVSESDKSNNQIAMNYSVVVPYDTTPPVVIIKNPTSLSSWTTTSNKINLSGTASDSSGIHSVWWSSSTGASGKAGGYRNWSVSNIGLAPGDNLITITARDAAGNTGTDTITVTYTPPDTTAPAVVITSPTTAPTWSTTSATISVGGTATDNVAVSVVNWANAATGASGTATGTTNWTVASINLAAGSNLITITARDAAGNTGTDTITVTNTVSGSEPGNDYFVNSYPLSGAVVYVTGSNVGATVEAGEPYHAGNIGGKSVWWSWTAPSSSAVRIATKGSSFDTLLGVYTGNDVSKLTTIASNDDDPDDRSRTSKVTFNAVAGVTYHIAVAGYNGASGTIALSISPPTVVAITTPADGSAIAGSIALTATATDSFGVARVDFYRDNNVSLGSATTPPYSVSFNTLLVTEGTYTFYAKVLNALSITTNSATVSALVDNTAPTVSLTAPGADSILKGVISISANATDAFGISKVEFYRDSGALIGTDTTAPYNVSFSTGTIADGFHQLFAKAYDKANNQTVSANVTVYVDNTAPSVPVIIGASAASWSRVDVFWQPSSDSGSGLKGYNVYRNGAFLTHVLAPVASVSDWSVSPATTYSYRVTAVDIAGNESAQSATATVSTPSYPTNLSADAGPDQNTIVGQAVIFDGSNSFDPHGTITSWVWDFGDGTTAGGMVVTHTYTTAGTYTVTLTVANDLGQSATDTAVVTVAPLPGSLQWVRQFGAGAEDYAYGVATDNDGNVIVTGRSVGGWGALYKYSRDGDLLWAKHWSCYTEGRAVAALSDGRIAVTGALGQPADFGGTTLSAAGGFDVFVAVYTADGTLVWAKCFGGNSPSAIVNESGTGIAVDSRDNIVVTGYFNGTTDLGKGTVTSRGNDVFLIKYAPHGACIWAKQFGDNGDDTGSAVAVDSSDSIILTGSFYRSIDFGGATLASDNHDVFVSKFSQDGTCQWAIGTRGILYNSSNAVAVDRNGDIAISGSFQGRVDFGGVELATDPSASKPDAFVAKYTATGSLSWVRAFGGAYEDIGYGVAFDRDGNIIATGQFLGAVNFGDGTLTSNGVDAFVCKFTPTGSTLWARRYGDTGADKGYAVTVDPGGNIIVGGRFAGTVSFGQNQSLTSAGSYDGFVLKLSP